MKHNITVAVIGSGYMGKKYLDALEDMVSSIILCSADEENGKSLAKEYNAKFYNNHCEMFESEKIDFVCLCIPTHLHYEIAMCAMEHNINVLCEKPFATDVSQAEEMVKYSKEQNVMLMVGHCVRFTKPYEYLRRCIKDERFGKLMYLNLFRHSTRPLWSVGGWLANMSLSGGVVADLHIHDTDVVEFLLGVPNEVYTTGNDYVSNTLYKFSDNIAVTSSASWRTSEDYPFCAGYDAVFENASLRITIRDNEEDVVYKDGKEENMLATESFSEFYETNNPVKNELIYFINCLLNNTAPEICESTDSLKTMYINHAERESLKNGVATSVNK